ncbi:MAG: cupin domain-containing protein, partial [Gaiellaceae bacterium]
MTDAERYFATEEAARAEGLLPRWIELDDVDPVAFIDGLDFKPVLGERALVNFVSYRPNTVVPRHAHEEEQFTFVLDGEFEFECDGETRTLRRGTVVHIPPGVPHAARTGDSACVQVDVFAPPRRVLVERMLEGRE